MKDLPERKYELVGFSQAYPPLPVASQESEQVSYRDSRTSISPFQKVCLLAKICNPSQPTRWGELDGGGRACV